MKGINLRSSAFHPLKLILLALISLWIKTVATGFIGFDFHLDSFLDLLMIIINPLGSILILLGLCFYFTGKFNKMVFIISNIAAAGLLYGDLLYYRFYSDFVTVPILFQFKNVGGIGPSTFELMSPWDLLLFLDLFILGWLALKLNFKEYISSKLKKTYIGVSVFLVCVTVGIGIIQSPYLFSASYDREQIVKSIGPYNYHLFDISLAVSSPINRIFASETDTAASVQYTDSNKNKLSDYFGIAEGKNLMLISMESTQDFVINETINGEEITPFLNDLIKESYYFNSIYDQTAQGKTSDSEFMIDTALYPLSSGSVFVRKHENIYHSLPSILKKENGYYNAVFHGNERTFWNRDLMYEALGYDRYFSERDYEVTEENSVNYGIKDIPFFQQTVKHLEKLPEPYYSRIITLTNHFPFLLDEEDIMIPPGSTDEEVVNRYVTTVRYQDEAIKQLFESLKDKGMYEDTVFVLYGDHYGISEKYEDALFELLGQQNTPVNHVELQQVPLIIHIPGQEGKTITNIGGEVDIRPTVLQLLGVGPQGTPSFGHNLFIRESNHPVIFRDGGFVTDQYVFKNNICYDKTSGLKELGDACEAFKENVHQELELSDEIINGDLLRFIDQ